MNFSEKALLLSNWIKESKVVTTVCHARPDGDAAGSSVAMAAYLEQSLSKDAASILPDALPSNLSFLTGRTKLVPGWPDTSLAEERLARTDLLVCLDFNNLSRTEGLEGLLRQYKGRKVLIDHHEDPCTEEFDLCFSDTGVSSTCELLYAVLLEMSGAPALALPPLTAEALMTGMTTDTNNFANSVHPGTLKMASELLAAGVDRDAIIDRLYFCERPQRLAAQGEMLSKHLHLLPEGGACIVLDADFLSRHDLREGETEGFVNMPLAIENVRVSVFARADGDRFRVSIRSKRGTSARLLAKTYFHGGGHEQASGGRILIPQDVASADEIRPYIEHITARFLQEQGTVEQQ